MEMSTQVGCDFAQRLLVFLDYYMLQLPLSRSVSLDFRPLLCFTDAILPSFMNTVIMIDIVLLAQTAVSAVSVTEPPTKRVQQSFIFQILPGLTLQFLSERTMSECKSYSTYCNLS
ncbi:hypothetical protein AVEN_180829-1 [Araneus ventricosus]|uniref:Uncharacterized protein n=1 Tax=Araneus ventricosus TaxID=182803 RepID=A0A4Y2V669_ARAVE|nr:hypothetical protein AVEN_180829-1 [Araneus ventricosus]